MPKTERFGKLPPRYSFLLNTYPSERLSKCPKCKRQTHTRKFALFILVKGWGPLVLGKTCKYCTPCEMIMGHQHEIAAELATGFARIDPKLVGAEFMAMGTVDMKVWRANLEKPSTNMEDMLAHTADFKNYFDLHVEPGGWRPMTPEEIAQRDKQKKRK